MRRASIFGPFCVAQAFCGYVIAQADCPWTQASNIGPSPRMASIAEELSTGNVLLFGGYVAIGGDNIWFNDTWRWDGTAWTQLVVAGPSARNAHGIASWADGTGSRVIVYGGTNASGVVLSDTWKWNGTSWSFVTSTGPGPRATHAMAFDSARNRTVVFGGLNSSQTLGSTWEFNGTSWALAATSGPPPRASTRMAFDESRNVMVLFGGTNLTVTQFFSDTWEWNGSSWTQAATSGPAARCLHGMAYDRTNQRVVLFGGFNGANFGDTWEWDGTSWTLQQIAHPSPRQSSGTLMAYDGVSDRVLLFGGWDGAFKQDTWTYPVCPPPPNDSCSSAAIAPAGSTDFSTILATTDGPDEPGSCSFGGYTHIDKDIWFLFPAQCTGTVLVGACRADFDTKIAVYGPSCPGVSGRAIACADNECGDDAVVSFPVSHGEIYRIRVGGANGASGSGTMTIVCSVCPADVNADGAVDIDDLLSVINAWGACATCTADLNGDQVVDVDDLLLVINAWGACP